MHISNLDENGPEHNTLDQTERVSRFLSIYQERLINQNLSLVATAPKAKQTALLV
jgi:hypothetical protein